MKDFIELTKEEEKAIASLERLAKRWPKSLWLYSASSSLCVMKCKPDGCVADKNNGESIDPDYLVTQIRGIHNDGGDW